MKCDEKYMSGQQVFRATVVVLLTLVIAYMLITNVQILVTLVIAIIIASALRPAAAALNRIGLSEGLSITLVYLSLAISIILMLALVISPVAQQFANYLDNENLFANRVIEAEQWIETTLSQVTGSTVTLMDPDGEAAFRQTITDGIEQVRVAAPSTLGVIGGALGNAVLAFVMGIYWLTSRDNSVIFLSGLFPRHRREQFVSLFTEIETTLGSYMRGAVLVATFVGFANFIVLAIFGVPNAGVLAFIIGATSLLPVIGGFIGAGVATILALLGTPLHGLIVLGTFVAVQQLEMHIVTPRVMSRRVGIDPLLVIIAVFVGFATYGTTGAIIAVPVAGTLAVLFQRLYVEPRHHEFEYKIVDGGVLIEVPQVIPPKPVENEPLLDTHPKPAPTILTP